MQLSLIVPCYNEQDNVEAFHDACRAAFDGRIASYELIFVNDGSRDDTWARLTALQESEMKVAATPTPTPTPTTVPDVQVMLENQMNASSAPAEEEGTVPADSDAAAEETPENESAESATSEDAASDSSVG